MIIFFQLIVLLFSAVIHEVAHGAAANALGDPTAKNMGRLTLNPLRHLDPFGSVILPLLLFVFRSPFVFGWAKPVPYNPYNLRWVRFGPAAVALAGPLSNIGIVAALGLYLLFFGSTITVFNSLIATAIFINIWLALINLVPVPPLDGSKILFAFLPARFEKVRYDLERYGLFIALFILFFGISVIASFADIIFRLIAGTSYFTYFIFLNNL